MLFLRSLQNQSHYCHKRIGPQDSGSASSVIQQITPYQALALLELFQLGARAQPNKRLPQMLPRLKIVMMLASAIQTLNIGKSRKPFLRKPRLLQWIGLALSAEAVLVKWSWNTLSPGDSKAANSTSLPNSLSPLISSGHRGSLNQSKGPRQCCSQQSSGSRQQPCG